MARKPRKPSRIQISRWRRAARKHESYIAYFDEFPPHIRRRVLRRFPHLTDAHYDMIEWGLREWFICSAWRGRSLLGMPSRAVDEAWHEFILDSVSYTRFCNGAFGHYLHHMPDETMSTAMGDALANTVRAWDRSDAGAERESVLWDLDESLGIAEPLGLNGLQVATARTAATLGPMAGACAAGFGGCGGGGGCSGGCSGGCGGGGCGGGGG